VLTLKKKLYLLLKVCFLSLFFILVFVALIGMGIFLHYSKSLPNIITLEDYKPKVVSAVYDKNNIKIGEYYRENRQILPFDQIPKTIVNAFVASEDGKFFEHKGLDFAGILRAMIANFKSGQFSQGGSTITQQVARSLLLTSEKKISRKVKEAILAGRIESHLKKQDILYLYLNQIFLGHNAYGVKAAASLYFGKDVKDITLAEAALLAGLPQAPSKWSPFLNPNKAKERQIYVLTRMVEDGYITKAQAEKAANERIKLYKRVDINLDLAPYFVEFVRKYMVAKYGDEKVLDEGVNIYTTLDSKLQTTAQNAIKEELKTLDKKQGFRGPTKRLKSDKEIEQEITAINKDIADSVRSYIYFPEPWQEFKIKNKMFVVEDKQNAQDLSKAKVPVPLDKGTNYKAVVLGINDKTQEIKVSVGYTQGVIRKEGFSWVYRGRLNNGVLRRGDVILVTLLKPGIFAIEQEPLVESALLSFNINDGSISAMVGGYSFTGSEFNRAYQAKRQAGSTFKPLVYSAALDKGYTPATVIMDSPIVYDDEDNNTTWKPTNYSEEFYGDTTVRDAIVFSRNIPTTKILQDIKVSYAKEYAKKLGIRSDMPNDLSLGLGSTAVSLWEMTKAFSVFASGGKRVVPYFITKIEDRNGNVIEQYDPSKPIDYIEGADEEVKTEEKTEEVAEDNNSNTKPQEVAKEGEKKIDLPPPGFVIPPQTAYLMNFLLKEAASKGTGAKAASALNIPLAGKTGTSNDFCDAWFIGYTPYIMTGVWVGYDDQSKSLGQGETGAEVSLPIWINYMREATSKTPKNDFTQPEGIKYLKIDGKTGKVAARKSAKVFYMPFKDGTEPTQVEGESGGIEDADETQFFRENY